MLASPLPIFAQSVAPASSSPSPPSSSTTGVYAPVTASAASSSSAWSLYRRTEAAAGLYRSASSHSGRTAAGLIRKSPGLKEGIVQSGGTTGTTTRTTDGSSAGSSSNMERQEAAASGNSGPGGSSTAGGAGLGGGDEESSHPNRRYNFRARDMSSQGDPAAETRPRLPPLSTTSMGASLPPPPQPGMETRGPLPKPRYAEQSMLSAVRPASAPRSQSHQHPEGPAQQQPTSPNPFAYSMLPVPAGQEGELHQWTSFAPTQRESNSRAGAVAHPSSRGSAPSRSRAGSIGGGEELRGFMPRGTQGHPQPLPHQPPSLQPYGAPATASTVYRGRAHTLATPSNVPPHYSSAPYRPQQYPPSSVRGPDDRFYPYGPGGTAGDLIRTSVVVPPSSAPSTPPTVLSPATHISQMSLATVPSSASAIVGPAAQAPQRAGPGGHPPPPVPEASASGWTSTHPNARQQPPPLGAGSAPGEPIQTGQPLRLVRDLPARRGSPPPPASAQQLQRQQMEMNRGIVPISVGGPQVGDSMTLGGGNVTAPAPSGGGSSRRRRRPPFSYSSLIAQAITCSPEGKMTLREIYAWISNAYPDLYQLDGPDSQGWQNTVRHNLSLNKMFVKVPRAVADVHEHGSSSLPMGASGHQAAQRGKGGFWMIDPSAVTPDTVPTFPPPLGAAARPMPPKPAAGPSASAYGSGMVTDAATSPMMEGSYDGRDPRSMYSSSPYGGAGMVHPYYGSAYAEGSDASRSSSSLGHYPHPPGPYLAAPSSSAAAVAVAAANRSRGNTLSSTASSSSSSSALRLLPGESSSPYEGSMLPLPQPQSSYIRGSWGTHGGQGGLPTGRSRGYTTGMTNYPRTSEVRENTGRRRPSIPSSPYARHYLPPSHLSGSAGGRMLHDGSFPPRLRHSERYASGSTRSPGSSSPIQSRALPSSLPASSEGAASRASSPVAAAPVSTASSNTTPMDVDTDSDRASRSTSQDTMQAKVSRMSISGLLND